MAKQERFLRVPRDPVLPSECTACGQKFVGKDILERFRAHNCHEDESQAAARVVRESTENH
jgi:hypothetical protein